jgi:catechol 2,3-dioxygenase-like lactoylglutathione lyase family enzyme
MKKDMKRIILLFGIVAAIVALLTAYESQAQTNQTTSKPKTTMKYQDVYPVFVTKDLTACKDFYGKWFNMQPVFESSFFILLVSADESSRSLVFLSEVHPSSPPTSPAMNAQAGVFLTLQVEDAKADFERLKKAGLKISYELKDEPWGQRRFGVTDPNGMYIDVVQQIEPEKGFWEKYPAKQ